MIEDNAVQPGTERWTELVTEARARDASRNWYLGDAALEIAPMGGNNNGTDNVEENLRRFASEVGVAYESLDQYRKVAAAWSSGTRLPDTSWKVHQVLAGQQSYIRPGMTVAQARAAKEGTVSGKIKVSEKKDEATETPDMAKQQQEQKLRLVKNSHGSENATTSISDAKSESENSDITTQQELASDKSENSTQAVQDIRDLVYTATNAVHVASRELSNLKLDDELRESLLKGVEHLERLVTVFREQLSGVTLDEELRKLMETGS
jgi:hypothetical protein